MELNRGAGRRRRLGRCCSYCGRELAPGEEYWYINGGTVCPDCLPEYAREDYAPFRHMQGEEAACETV